MGSTRSERVGALSTETVRLMIRRYSEYSKFPKWFPTPRLSKARGNRGHFLRRGGNSENVVGCHLRW